MKTLSFVTLVAAGLALVGCNPDHSSDVQASVPISQMTKTTDRFNPAMPADAKKALGNVTAIPPSGSQ